MKVLVACEFSGIVRDAFRKRGHDAYSCDLLDSETGDNQHHLKGNIYRWHSQAAAWSLFGEKVGWDLMVAFPPCTHLASSGARWFKDKKLEQEDALNMIRTLLTAPICKIALENPVGIISTKIRKPDQIIQPWMFGHPETKATCLWLKNLPLLKPTKIVEGRRPRVHHESPGPDRWKRRSRTFQGVADAMAEQWGNL